MSKDYNIGITVSDKQFIGIEEHCGNEGETWKTFLVMEGNEGFIEKLRDTLDKFPDLTNFDNYLKMDAEPTAEYKVDILVDNTGSGYYDYFNKSEKIVPADIIIATDEDNFVDSFYKRKYFDED